MPYPTAFLMSLIDKPMLFAVNIGALRVECAVNMVMRIPYMPKKTFTYRAIVCELTGLCGYACDKVSCCGVPLSNNAECIYTYRNRFSLKRSVCDLYTFKAIKYIYKISHWV